MLTLVADAHDITPDMRARLVQAPLDAAAEQVREVAADRKDRQVF